MEINEKKLIKYLILIAGLVFAIINSQLVTNFVMRLFSVASPVIIAAVMAYVLNILMVRFERLINSWEPLTKIRKYSRPIAILFSILVISAVMLLVIVLVLPQLVNLVAALIDSVPKSVQAIQNWLEIQRDKFPVVGEILQRLNIDWGSLARDTINLLNSFSQNVVGSAVSIVGNAFATTMNFILSLMLAIYILISKETLINQAKRIADVYLPHKVVSTSLYVFRELNRAFESFFTGAVIESFILGTVIALGMILIRLPYAAMIGVLTGVLALIPLLGAYISAGIGFVLILSQSFSQAMIYLVFVIIVQQIEGNFIYPKVVGNSIGLPGMWVLVSVTVGGGLFGIPGMIIGVPLAAALYAILKNDVKRREESETKGFQEFVQEKNTEYEENKLN